MYLIPQKGVHGFFSTEMVWGVSLEYSRRWLISCEMMTDTNERQYLETFVIFFSLIQTH